MPGDWDFLVALNALPSPREPVEIQRVVADACRRNETVVVSEARTDPRFTPSARQPPK
jgi:hypothetical protein